MSMLVPCLIFLLEIGEKCFWVIRKEPFVKSGRHGVYKDEEAKLLA